MKKIAFGCSSVLLLLAISGCGESDSSEAKTKSIEQAPTVKPIEIKAVEKKPEPTQNKAVEQPEIVAEKPASTQIDTPKNIKNSSDEDSLASKSDQVEPTSAIQSEPAKIVSDDKVDATDMSGKVQASESISEIKPIAQQSNVEAVNGGDEESGKTAQVDSDNTRTESTAQKVDAADSLTAEAKSDKEDVSSDASVRSISTDAQPSGASAADTDTNLATTETKSSEASISGDEPSNTETPESQASEQSVADSSDPDEIVDPEMSEEEEDQLISAAADAILNDADGYTIIAEEVSADKEVEGTEEVIIDAIVYRCDDDFEFTIVPSANWESVTLKGEGIEQKLDSEETETGVRYTGGGLAYFGDGVDAKISRDGNILHKGCQVK